MRMPGKPSAAFRKPRVRGGRGRRLRQPLDHRDVAGPAEIPEQIVRDSRGQGLVVGRHEGVGGDRRRARYEKDQRDPGVDHLLQRRVQGGGVDRRDEDRVRRARQGFFQQRGLLGHVVGRLRGIADQRAAEALGQPGRADLRPDIGRVGPVLGQAAQPVAPGHRSSPRARVDRACHAGRHGLNACPPPPYRCGLARGAGLATPPLPPRKGRPP